MALGWRKEYLRYRAIFLNVLSVYKSKEDLRIFMEILLSLATIILFGIFALKPTALTIADLYNQIKNKNETIALMTTKITNLQSAQKILGQQASFIPILDSAIPSVPTPEDLVHQVEGLATKNGVGLSGFSIDKTLLKGDLPKNEVKKSDSPFPDGAQPMSFSLSV